MTAPHTDRPFDAVEGATALSATRFHFMWTCVSADSPSSAPLLSAYFPFFHCRGLDFVTNAMTLSYFGDFYRLCICFAFTCF